MPTLKLLQITIFLALFSSLVQIQADENPPNLENKCGDCPCDHPCTPKPSPPPPSPPPPSPSPPPPSPKYPPPSYLCPPPPDEIPPKSPNPPDEKTPPKGPNPPSISINGPPGSVYSVIQTYSGGCRTFLVGNIPFLIVLWALAF
ncbi:leucine-rich repeat extensin-like protein 1 [Salvia hispanica]|uniref:leucine-rich repeat extensin-like protein 1 n=1 Tax=Salvia hispanica TaxID=49212 RepID=UPI0020096A9A|nr:leucine-rich repeat extensin-like protein 1 [Salvia hispanica]